MASNYPLEGYRVLDFTQVLAGPTTTRLMVEMGAEILKVELPPHGDMSRGFPFQRNGRSGYYIQQNRGKKSLCLNPRDPRGQEILKDLVKSCDILVENFSPGVIGRLGLDWETVHALNPRLIMCSISTFGQTGPLAKKPGFDYIGASYAGVIDMIGEADGSPYFPLLGVGDVSVGVHALAGILAALLQREKTGRGQFIDVSLLDAYFHCHEVNVQVCSASGGEIVPRRCGRHHYVLAPLGLFRAKDGYLFIIAITPTQWTSFCQAIGRPDLLEDPRFAAPAARTQHVKDLEEIIESWLDGLPSLEAAVEILDKAHVPVAPILTVKQVMEHPHMIERRTIRTVTDPVFGSYQIPGMPIRLSEMTEELPLTAAFLGQHNEEVLTGYLGRTPEQVRELEQAGVLIAKPDLDRAQAAE